jgi:two-component system sensor histidine kinase RegB
MIRSRITLTHRIGPVALARTLAWLRLCAIAGQSVAVLVSALVMHLTIPLLPLMLGVGMLAVFGVAAAWRLSQSWPLLESEIVCHIAIDTLVLGYLLYFTGGASNPFVTLLLVPIALSAAALSSMGVMAVASLAGMAYLLLARFYVPLPNDQEGRYSEFHLQVAGMGVNFVIMAVLLGFFINTLARAVRVQQMEVQRTRERALRDEGILAIATQAAGAAHELNTPLSTMRMLLPEIGRDHGDDAPLKEDLDLLLDQVERCRMILREMVAFGKMQLSQEPERQSVAVFVHGCLERFQLLRPEADLALTMDNAVGSLDLRAPPALRHALINLLNNAVDASALNESNEVGLKILRDGPWLELVVLDRGPGFADDGELSTSIGGSEKQTGLGIGLALAEATAERLSGELAATNTGQGAEVRLRLPLAVIGDSA